MYRRKWAGLTQTEINQSNRVHSLSLTYINEALSPKDDKLTQRRVSALYLERGDIDWMDERVAVEAGHVGLR